MRRCLFIHPTYFPHLHRDTVVYLTGEWEMGQSDAAEGSADMATVRL